MKKDLFFLFLLTSFVEPRKIMMTLEDTNQHRDEIRAVFRKFLSNAPSFLFCLVIDIEVYNWPISKGSVEGIECPHIISTPGDRMITTGGKLVNLPTLTFIFAKNHEELDDKINSAVNFGFYAPKTRTAIVLVDPVENLDFLQGFMRRLWRLKLYRYIVILFHEGLKVFAYNPFKELVISVKDFADVHAVWLFSNMHLYKLRLVLFQCPPGSYKIGNVWQGFEKRFWENLISDLNATAEVIETSPYMLDEAKFAVKTGLADVCPLSYFRTDTPDDLDFSEPHYVQNLVAVVPNSIRIENSWIGYQSSIWINLVLAIAALSACILAIEWLSPTARKNLRTGKVMDFIGISVGRSIINESYASYNWSQKCLLLLWQVESIVLIAAFQYGVLSTLLIARFGKQIDTLPDLIESNLTVQVLSEYTSMVKQYIPQLEKQVVRLPRSEILTLLDGDRLKRPALVMPLAEASMLMHLMNRNDTMRYHLMEEALLPGFFSFFFTKNSPFVEIINRKVMRKYEFGLNRGKEDRFDYSMRSSRNSYTPLSFNHLRVVFNAIGIGLAFSLICFFLEIIRSTSLRSLIKNLIKWKIK